MAQFASESFTGTEGAELAAHNAAFTKCPSLTGAIEIASNRGRCTSTTSPGYYHSGAPASADYQVTADLTKVSAAVSFIGVLGRQSTSVNTSYRATVDPTSSGSTGTMQLFKFVAGVATQLGSSTSVTYVTSETREIKLEMVGSAIKVFWDGSGSPTISVTDTAISAAGKAGVRGFSSAAPGDSVGGHITNFSADDIGGGSATGTLAATESGSDTAAFAGDVLIDGSLAASETGSDTAAFAGDVYITGTLAATESGSDTAAFTGTSAVVTTGTLAATETGSDTAAFAGDVLIDGVLAATESGSDTAAFAGDVFIDGTLAATESGSDTAAFTGTAAAAISGTLAASESGSDTAAFTNVTTTRDGEGGGEGRIRRGVKPKRKPKYLIEVDGKFVVVDSPEEARQVLSPKPVKKGKKAAKKAVPEPSIAPIIDLGRVEDYADLIGEIEQFDAAMQSRHYQQILAMFDQMQDDEDVELLLLAL